MFPPTRVCRPAPIVPNGVQEFAEKQSEFQINSAMRSLLSALQTGTTVFDTNDEKAEKPRRVLLCLGDRKEEVAKLLTASGYRVYIAETSAQANERLREGKTELVIFSPDFAAEFGGAAILQQKANELKSSSSAKFSYPPVSPRREKCSERKIAGAAYLAAH